MWIVRLALNRPYTFVVVALMILLVSPVVILRTPTDIFPGHQHSGGERRLELRRHVGRRKWRTRIVTV